MDKLKMHSPDITQHNINKLLELFPNCKTEKQDDNGELSIGVDFDLLKQELSKNIVEGPKERYQLNWPGKKEALLTANAPIAKTLRPCREESVDFDTTENLFIEGDNLDALKLLQETYLGKIKMIYIDPPYNTGKDFIYADNFAESTDEYLQESGQKDEDGGRLVANTDSNGRFHSDWLSMMHSRLKLARNLLSQDGAIFISIDSNEVFNLKLLCDETFGDSNFCADFVIKSNPRGSQSNGFSAKQHEYILCYARQKETCSSFTLALTQEMQDEYNRNDSRGAYRYLGLRLRGGSWRREQRPLLFYPIYVKEDGEWSLEDNGGKPVHPIKPSTGEDGTWRWSKQKMLKDQNLITTKKVQREGSVVWDVFTKDYLNSIDGEKKGTKPKSLFDEKEVNYQNGANELKHLFDDRAPFDFPKPTYLVKKLIEMHCDRDAIVLDFFCGSSTTAHAVMKLNAEDNGKRRFIKVQLPEICDEKSVAFKSGYRNIAEVSKERIRRVGKKIKEENSQSTELDGGFRVLKIDSSNMNEVYYTPDTISKDDLFNQVEHIKTDRSNEDLLFQVMLDWGVDLSLPIRKETIEGKEVYFVNDDDLVACFDKGIDEALIKSLAANAPRRVVFRDDGFGTGNDNDSVKINAEQIFKQLAPATDIKAI